MIGRRVLAGAGGLLLPAVLILLWFGMARGQGVAARPEAPLPGGDPFTPPLSITVEMYRLTASGAQRLPLTMCSADDTAFGCTAFCSESGYGCPGDAIFPYPYLTGTITVGVETDYLLDVVPREMGPWYDPVALEAQAVAARSFAFYYTASPPTLLPYNNSASFQAFIPRTFERQFPENYPNDEDFQWDDPCGAQYEQLNSAQQLVCDALREFAYLSYGDQSPLRAQFSADAYGQTVDGSTAGLEAVPDPISTACDADNLGHGRGMSQEGASRWARGNECSYPGAPVVGDNPPGGAWSVAWQRDQILAHYYTGIHLRGPDGEQLTPDYRWNPLAVDWGVPGNQPPVFSYPLSIPITIWVQNTGTTTWLTGTVGMVQVWKPANPTGTLTGTFRTAITLTRWMTPGGSAQVPLTLTTGMLPAPGVYTLTIDLAVADGSGGWLLFSQAEPARPWFPLSMVVGVDAAPVRLYLPLVGHDP